MNKAIEFQKKFANLSIQQSSISKTQQRNQHTPSKYEQNVKNQEPKHYYNTSLDHLAQSPQKIAMGRLWPEKPYKQQQIMLMDNVKLQLKDFSDKLLNQKYKKEFSVFQEAEISSQIERSNIFQKDTKRNIISLNNEILNFENKWQQLNKKPLQPQKQNPMLGFINSVYQLERPFAQKSPSLSSNLNNVQKLGEQIPKNFKLKPSFIQAHRQSLVTAPLSTKNMALSIRNKANSYLNCWNELNFLKMNQQESQNVKQPLGKMKQQSESIESSQIQCKSMEIKSFLDNLFEIKKKKEKQQQQQSTFLEGFKEKIDQMKAPSYQSNLNIQEQPSPIKDEPIQQIQQKEQIEEKQEKISKELHVQNEQTNINDQNAQNDQNNKNKQKELKETIKTPYDFQLFLIKKDKPNQQEQVEQNPIGKKSNIESPIQEIKNQNILPQEELPIENSSPNLSKIRQLQEQIDKMPSYQQQKEQIKKQIQNSTNEIKQLSQMPLSKDEKPVQQSLEKKEQTPPKCSIKDNQELPTKFPAEQKQNQPEYSQISAQFDKDIFDQVKMVHSDRNPEMIPEKLETEVKKDKSDQSNFVNQPQKAVQNLPVIKQIIIKPFNQYQKAYINLSERFYENIFQTACQIQFSDI